MLTFDQLTQDQQNDAYLFAAITLQTALASGDIVFTTPKCQEDYDRIARDIAEISMYNDDGTAYQESLDQANKYEVYDQAMG